MNKNILIFIFIGITIFNTFTFAQKKDSTFQLEEVIIQENRLQIPFSETSRNIILVPQEEIQATPVQSLPEVLSYVGGVDVRQRGVFGTSADIGIRGGTFEQTLVLLNGVRMSDPQTGHHALSLPLDFMRISQIEVLKGAAARTYGQNALAGVVNIRTEIPDEKKVFLRAYGGDFGLYGIGFGQSLPHDKYAQQFYFSRDASETGFRENTDFVNYNLFYQSKLKTNNGDFNFLASHSQRNFGANGFYASPAFTQQYEEVGISLVSVDYEYESGNWRITPRVYWRRGEDMYLFTRNNPQAFRNLHVTQSYGAELHLNWENDWGNTGFGIENRNEDIQSSNLGEHQRSNIGFFVEHRFDIQERLDITAGVYTNYFTDFGWQAFPGLDVGYQISEELRFFGTVGRAYRIPTYTDLYYRDRATLGNPNLRPEESLSYEGGVKFLQKGFFATASYYARRDENLIDYLINPTTNIGEARNINRVNTSGFEAVFNVDFRRLVNPNFFINRLNISYNYIEAQTDLPENVQTRYTLENYNHQLIIGLNHKILRNVYHQAQFRFLDRVTASDYYVLDSRIYWQKDGKSIFVEATNITNTVYQELLVDMPTRWFKAGVNWSFGL